MHEGVRSSMCEKFGASLETLGQLLDVHRAVCTLSGLLFTSLGIEVKSGLIEVLW